MTKLSPLLLLLALLTPSARATVVSGQVTDPGGAPLFDVDLDFIDTATGMVVPTPNDNTDVLGYYAVDVPPGTYDVQFEPQPGERWVQHEEPGVVVGATPVTLDQVLQPGFLVRARIVDPDGLPIDRARLDVTDPVSGVQVYSNLDRAGPDGIVQPVVPNGTWDLKFDGPVGSPYLPVIRLGERIDADRDYGDVALVRAFEVSGRVVGTDGPPVASAQVSAVDAITGLPPEGFPEDGANALGEYALYLPAGSYRFDVRAPFDSPYAARSFFGIVVDGALVLPDLPLDRAALLSGRVVDERSVPVAAADLDFDETHTGLRLPTIQDDTDPMGGWSVVVPLETWDVSVDPPVGSSFVAVRRTGVVVDGDRTLPDLVLLDGTELSARVLAPGGAPAQGVKVGVSDAATGDELELWDDRTDAAGLVTVWVPAGTWTVTFRPPRDSGWGQAVRTGVVVAGATDLGDVALAASVTPTVASVLPSSGPEEGGTLVTVTGTGFEDGARVYLDGRPLADVACLGPAMLQGTTLSHHRGAVDVEVVNPGAGPVVLAGGYAYQGGGAGPVLRLRREGPFGNDLLLEWSADRGPGYAVYRSDSPTDFRAAQLVKQTGRLSWRDEGATDRPGLEFYVVH